MYGQDYDDDGEPAEGLLPAPADPSGAAREFLHRRHEVDGFPTLLHWRGEFLRWDCSCWRPMTDAAVRAELYSFFERAECLDREKRVPWLPNRKRIADVLEALAAGVRLPDDVQDRSWLAGGTGWHAVRATAALTDELPDPRDLIVLRGGLLHTRTRMTYPATPRFFALSKVDIAVEDAMGWTACHPVPEETPSSAWESFVSGLWPDDPDAVTLLQEWFGYVLSGDTRQQKMLLVVGPPRSGKGTIGRVMQSLLGDRDVAASTLSSLAQNFGLSSLIGKSLAIVADARFGGQSTDVVVERLLSITGEDLQTIDRKHQALWIGRLGCRFMVMTNELPRLGDASGALASRFLILRTSQSWLGREDLGLEDRIRSDMAGILRWALDGLDRLRERGRFTAPESSREDAADLVDLASPVSAFIRDRCVTGPEREVPAADLYEAWSEWCAEQGRRPSSAQVFGRDLRAAAPAVRMSQPRTAGGRVRLYQGIDCRCHCANGAHGIHGDGCPAAA